MTAKTVELGYFFDGHSVVYATAEVEITHQKREAETIDHQHTTAYHRLSITGTERAVTNGRRVGNGISWGQIDSGLRKMTPCDRFGNPQEISPDIARLLEVWDYWHLNDMRPNCWHQYRKLPEPCEGFGSKTWYGSLHPAAYEVSTAIEQAKCPYGYKWGSAWLVEILPHSIHEWYARL